MKTPKRKQCRSFEEICEELKESMGERGWIVELSPCGAAHVVKNKELHCIIGYNGTLEIIPEEGSSIFETRDLATLSSACTEIATSYTANHNKS